MNSLETNNIPVGYKDSAVGIIPQEWEVKALGEAYKLQGGYAFKSELFADIGIPIVRISNLPMDSNIVDITDCVYYPSTESIKEQFIIKQGMLLIAMSGATTGKSAVYNNQNSSYLNQRVGMFCSKNDDITYNYLLQLVQSPLYSNALKPLLIAGAQPNIAPSDVENMKFPVPPIEEQRKIAEILGVWDEAIEKQSRLIEKLELRKRGLMQRLLTGRTRLSGFTTPWQKIKLSEAGIFLSTNTLSREKLNDNDGYIQNIHYGDILVKYSSIVDAQLTAIPYINTGVDISFDYLENGDIVFSDTAEDSIVGKAIEISNIADNKIVAGLHTMLYRPNKGCYAQYFLGYYINSDAYRKQLAPLIQGIKVCSISKKAISQTVLETPPLPEQKAIAEVLTAADNEIATHHKKLSALRHQKRGLMQQLLTGKTRVKI